MKTQLFKVRIEAPFLTQDQKELDDFLKNVKIVKSESAFNQQDEFWSILLFYESKNEEVSENSKARKYSAENEMLNTDENKLLESLKEWRLLKASEEKLPSYFIASNNELRSVAKMKPQNEKELIQIKGFGKYKIENYGKQILEIVAEL